ncbi:MAG: polyhydroxyalkanoate synthesis regulator DNA-binding domain-containing protein [Deltaproteobacteria bacterium]|nr:polyhydroxyalkanoate synthesis regulator DNA-binding domain-containing protein [Deltaproteobacteria bacterium]
MTSYTKTAAEPTRSGSRIIKRYSNRKLYDTAESRYVTLQQVGEMVRSGEDVRIIDNETKEDKTEATLALILSEDLKSTPRRVPLGALRSLLQERGERLLSQLRDGPIGRLIPGALGEGQAGAPPAGAPEAEAAPAGPAGASSIPAAVGSPAEEKPARDARTRVSELVETTRQAIEQLHGNLDERVRELQTSLDERVRAVVPGVGLVRELREQVAALTRRVEAIERLVGPAPERGATDHRGDDAGGAGDGPPGSAPGDGS